MVDAAILFRIGDATYTGNDVPQLALAARSHSIEAAHDLYAKLAEVESQVLAPRLRRAKGDEEDVGLRLCERSAFLHNDAYVTELQAFYNGFHALSEHLSAHVRLRSLDQEPVSVDCGLVLYAVNGAEAYRYQASVDANRIVDRSGPVPRIRMAREAKQHFTTSLFGLDDLIARDKGCARYLFDPLPPHLRGRPDLVRLFLHHYVGLKLHIYREKLDTYPLLS